MVTPADTTNHCEVGGELDEGGVERRRRVPVWMFGLLVLPYAGYSNGFLSTALGFLLRRDSVPVGHIADEIAILGLPGMLYFLWSPLTDFWMRRRTWNAVAAFATGGLLLAAFLLPSFAGVAPEVLLFLAMCVVMMTSSALGGLMAAVVPAELKRRASSFYQGGSLGWGALGGGGLLMLAEHMARVPLGIVVASVIALPGLLSLTVDEPPLERHEGGLGAAMCRIGVEFKETFWRWSSVPVLLMLCSPLGSGAAQGLLPSIATEYGVSGNSVAWMNGVAGGLLTALGALVVGHMKMPEDMRPAYCWAGLANAGALGILCLGHPRPSIYFAAVGLYLLTVGGCYALFTALVLQLLGVAGKSGSGRYAIAVSLGNAPISYMAKVDGLGYGWFGVKGLPGIDMAVSAGVAVCFLVWLRWGGRRDCQR